MGDRIDEIDETLIELCQERAELSKRIGGMRVAAGDTRLILAREHEVLRRFHRALGAAGTQLALLLLKAGRG
jgi:chorismate mutase